MMTNFRTSWWCPECERFVLASSERICSHCWQQKVTTLSTIEAEIERRERKLEEPMYRGYTPEEKYKDVVFEPPVREDNWVHRNEGMKCHTCMFYVPKAPREEANRNPTMGRCRRHAPELDGWPVVFLTDWCGDHKLDEEKI